MIAIIQFKDVPGRRFEVLPAESGYCGTNQNATQCAFFPTECAGNTRFDMCAGNTRFDMCREARVFFTEVSRDDQE